MTKVDDEDIAALRRSGIKVICKSNSEKPAGKAPKEEIDYLRDISAQLVQLTATMNKPVPAAPKVEPPNIVVKPPEVTVNNPEPEPRIKNWKFSISRDSDGLAKEITATAIT